MYVLYFAFVETSDSICVSILRYTELVASIFRFEGNYIFRHVCKLCIFRHQRAQSCCVLRDSWLCSPNDEQLSN